MTRLKDKIKIYAKDQAQTKSNYIVLGKIEVLA